MTPDEVKQSITTWCSSDDDLEIASDRFEPGTDFSFGLKAGTLSTSPVDLIVLKADGADRVTIRRSVTLTGDNVDAANQLVASRPGSVTAAVERSGADTTVVAQTYVYLDGLSKHTFVQAVAELARTSTLLDAIGGVETASVVDQEAASVASDAVDADFEPDSTAVDEAAVTPTPAIPAASTFQQPAFPQPSSIPSGTPVGQPLPTPSFTPQPYQPAQAQPVQPATRRNRLRHTRHNPSRLSRRRSQPLRVGGRRATRFRRRACARGVPLTPPDPWWPTSRPVCPFRSPRSAEPGHE